MPTIEPQEPISISEPIINPDKICASGLNEIQAALMNRMVYAIIRPAISAGLDAVWNNEKARNEFFKYILEKCNEYAEFIRMFGGHNYYTQLMLENTIVVLRDIYGAPTDFIKRLEEKV